MRKKCECEISVFSANKVGLILVPRYDNEFTKVKHKSQF